VSNPSTKKAGTGNRQRTGRARRWLSLLLLVAGCAGFALLLIFNSQASALSKKAGSETAPDEIDSSASQGDFSVFSHAHPAHSRLTCLLCHRREDNSPQPRLPGHTPCAGCHQQEFANSNSNLCNICHTDRQTGAVKAFPRMRSFNVKFDHAQHTAGTRTSCAVCHKPERRGVSLSIPIGLSAHSTCYQCHTPRAQSGGRDISSCSTCHGLGRLARTSENARSYRVNFSHADHGGRARLNCASCHNVRPGASQGTQVTAPVPQMHHVTTRAQSCMSCHNDTRAFGTENFANCKRCHEGSTFRFSFFQDFLKQKGERLTSGSMLEATRSHDL
jgi:c(7)-type cytochrome triheme protein